MVTAFYFIVLNKPEIYSYPSERVCRIQVV